jgi:hypothetical protein
MAPHRSELPFFLISRVGEARQNIRQKSSLMRFLKAKLRLVRLRFNRRFYKKF